MKTRRNIWQLISFLLVLVALLNSATTSIYVEKLHSKAKDTEKSSSKSDADQDQLVVRAAGFEAIVSALHFNLSHDNYFDFIPVFSDVFLKFTGYTQEPPLIILSYFKNTFCHLIAINAP